MARVIANDPLKSLMMKDTFADVTNKTEDIILSLFTGTPPTKTALMAGLSYHGDGWVYPNNILTVATGQGSTELLRAEYNDFGNREHLDVTKMRYNLSKRAETFVPLADGDAGWFVLFEQDEGTAYASNRVLRWGCVGTVGAVGSGADLELPSVTIDSTKRYKLNDIIVNPQINGVV